MSGQENIALRFLADLERNHNVVEAFAFRGSSGWIAVKNALFEASLIHFGFPRMSVREYMSRDGLRLLGKSAVNYLRMALRQKPAPAFFGAGSGIFEHQGQILDSYLPQALETHPGVPQDGIVYMVSATYIKKFLRHEKFLEQHDAAIFSLLIAPVRSLLAKIVLPFLRWTKPSLVDTAAALSTMAAAHGISLPASAILRAQARFAAGMIAYGWMLTPLRITSAYIVSPYSYSDLVAALKRRGIKVSEVQHGMIGATHRGYNYAIRDARLPAPDIVEVYNNFWRDELLATGFFDGDAIVVGRRLKYDLMQTEAPAKFAPFIVFTGQGLRQTAEVFIRQFASSETKLHLLYVPHPLENADDIAMLCEAARGDARIHILAQKPCTTERLIMDSVAHVSVFSSCHFDAIHYKKKTYVLDVIDQNVMHPYILARPDAVISITTAADMIEKVDL